MFAKQAAVFSLYSDIVGGNELLILYFPGNNFMPTIIVYRHNSSCFEQLPYFS